VALLFKVIYISSPQTLLTMKATIYAAMLLATISLSSCATYKYTHLNGPETARVPPASVNTYTRYSQIEPQVKDIQPVGKITYKAKKEAKVWNKAREIAAKHGANSVYMGQTPNNDNEFHTTGVIYTFNKKQD
jgi:hypothetical protein